jgi:hypothetical protein
MHKFADHTQKITVAVFVNTEFSVAILMPKNRGVGHNNGNTTDTVYNLFLVWCWTTFAFNTAVALLGEDS